MKSLLIGTLVVLCAGGFAGAADYTIDFESYSLGNVVGVDGWLSVGANPPTATSATVVSDASPLGGGTKCLKLTGGVGFRVARDFLADNTTGFYLLGYDFKYASTGYQSILYYPKGTTTQIFQQSSQNGGFGGFTDDDGLGPAGYVWTALIGGAPMTSNKWYRIEYYADIDARMFHTFRIYDISSGSKVLVAGSDAPTYWSGTAFTSPIGRIGFRSDSTNAAEWYEVDNFSMTQVTPSGAPNVAISSDTVYAGLEYKRRLMATPIVPATWSVLSGPSTTVSSDNLLQGWTPSTPGTTATYTVQATNTAGSSSGTWDVGVISDLFKPPVTGFVDRGRGAILTPAGALTFYPKSLLEPQTFARFPQAGNGYYNIYANINRDKNGGTVDITNCQTVLSVGLRYFQGGRNTNPYGDAPIFLRLGDAGGKNREYNTRLLYQSGGSQADPERYPSWVYRAVVLNDNAKYPFTDGSGFSPTSVSRVELWGTDWSGKGEDFVDFKDLVVSTTLGIYPVLSDDVAYANVLYRRPFMVNTCNTAPTWTKVAGPDALTIDAATGVATWTPAAEDVNKTFTVTIQATSDGGPLTLTYQVTVVPQPPTIFKSVIASSQTVSANGKEYTYQVRLLQGTEPMTWTVLAGPSGLTAGPNGVLSGWTPTAADIGKPPVTVTVKVANTAGEDTASWTVSVVACSEKGGVAMDQQINDAISAPEGTTVTFVPAALPNEPEGFCRAILSTGGGWYTGPDINLIKAGVGAVDINDLQARMEADFRYFQSPTTNTDPYGDAPVFLRLDTLDDTGAVVGSRDYSIIYGPSMKDSPDKYPVWQHKIIYLNNYGLQAYSDSGSFDPAKVGQVHLYGTDWTGGGDDFVDIKKILFTSCISGPILRAFTPDPDGARVTAEYVRAISLARGEPPITWTVLAGPTSLTVDETGKTGGWTPTTADLGTELTITVKAENSGGTATESWVARVVAKTTDLTGDGKVNIDDLDAFVQCITSEPVAGPMIPVTNPDNAKCDLDGDQDIDQTDFGIFQKCYGWTNTVATDANCAG